MYRPIFAILLTLAACTIPAPIKPSNIEKTARNLDDLVNESESSAARVKKQIISEPVTDKTKEQNQVPNAHLEEALKTYREIMIAAGQHVHPRRSVIPYTPNVNPNSFKEFSPSESLPEIVLYRDGLRFLNHHPDPEKKQKFRRTALRFFLAMGYPFVDEAETLADELSDYTGLVAIFERREDYEEAARFAIKNKQKQKALLLYAASEYVPIEAENLAREFLKQDQHPKYHRAAITILETRARTTNNSKLFIEAAISARKRGWWRIAMRNYTDGGIPHAGSLYIQNDSRKEIERLVESGQINAARRLAIQVYNYEILGALEGIPSGSKRKTTACSIYDR